MLALIAAVGACGWVVLFAGLFVLWISANTHSAALQNHEARINQLEQRY